MLPPELKMKSAVDAGYLRITAQGTHALPRSIGLIEWTAAESLRQNAARVLLDCRGIEGQLSTMDRYELGVAISSIPVKVAIILRQAMMDPDRFGEIVARNRGANARVFTAEDEAIEWLLSTEPLT